MADEGGKEAAEKAPAKKGGLMGPLVATVILVALGVGGSLAVLGMLRSDPETPDETPSDLIRPQDTREIKLGDLVTNIPGENGRRYVKVTCMIWVSPDDYQLISSDGSEGAISLTRAMQMNLEARLKTYNLQQLTDPGIITSLKADFTRQIESDLRRHLYADRKGNKNAPFVKDVILNGLLVQ